MSYTFEQKNYFGNNADGDGILKIKLTARPLKSQSNMNAGISGIRKGNVVGSFIFLLPSTFSETISHQWENYDSVGTRAGNKLNATEIAAKQAAEVAKGIKKGNTGNVITQKYDTPITYTNSNRRSLDLTFQLADNGDTKNDIFMPVRTLERFSCAEKKNGSNVFKPPYVFEVKTTKNSKLVYMSDAALQSVQPTYYGPYRKGYPSKCELTLNFIDITPLYRRSLII